MRPLSLTNMLCAGALVLLSNPSFAHGGSYAGPPDVVPPSPGSGGGRPSGPAGPTTGQPTGPTAPAPAGPATGTPTGPSTGAPTAPTTPGMGGRTTGGMPLTVDLSAWDLWWEFNKDSFLHLKDAVHRTGPETGSLEFYIGRRMTAFDTLKPTDNQILNDVLPALKRAIDGTDQRDIASSCMVAMAKIGRDHPTFRLVDVFAPRLRRNDQEVRETAALAIGIAGIHGATEVDLLVGLALDDQTGRVAYGGEVDDRTRSFAAYGLGLLAHGHASAELKSKALHALASLVDDDRIQRNLKVAAIEAIGILAPGTSTPAERKVLADCLQCLESYYDKPLGSGEMLIAAHCPTAIAKLVGRTHERSGHFRDRFVADLTAPSKQKKNNDIARSCALALGQLGQPVDQKDGPGAACSAALFDTYVNHRDHQTRYFAILALGQIGGAENRRLLVDTLDKAKGPDRQWCALAAGVHSFLARRAAEQTNRPVDNDRRIGELLFDEFKQARAPEITSALAVALGLDRHIEAVGAMRERLLGDLNKQDQAGYLCIGLALMGDRAATEDVHKVLVAAGRRTELMRQAAIALGCLGDKTAAEYLRTRLDEGSNLTTLAAVSEALGFIGDRNSIKPLQDMLFDTDLGALSRAFAAVALGGIADRAPLPWNAKIKANINYRASVETLTNQQSGILDIL